MNAPDAGTFGRLLAYRPHVVLALHLMIVHLLAFGGWQNPAVRLLWLVALGLFLIWQPFIAGERPISTKQGLLLFAAALATIVALSPWLLLIWCGALAAVIGGRVIGTERRRERNGYLLAFGYLVGLIIFGVVPEISPAVALDPGMRDFFAAFMPFMLVPLLFLAARPARPERRRNGDAFDLFYALTVFLVLAVFVLGALAYMLVGGVAYIESLFKTSFGMAFALLVTAWAWNPRAGFAGIGSAISRYMLTVGMPLEQWLVLLSEASEQEAEPGRFLSAAMKRLQGTPWITGASWLVSEKDEAFGIRTSHFHEFRAEGVLLVAYFRHSPSPAMRWHVEWLLRLVAEFYLVKRQAHDLQRLGYVQAVYETGARVTHDVKNLLQSMQTLCYAATQPGDPAELAGLLGRQLPQIAERLKITLDKLQSPRDDSDVWTGAGLWWAALQDRFAGADVHWQGEALEGDLPRGLYDSVAENLLQNALAKRQRTPGLQIAVGYASGVLSVKDDGPAIPATFAKSLMHEPVRSEDGLGIGLFHAARQAEHLGYVLELAENSDGCVRFRLGPKP